MKFRIDLFYFLKNNVNRKKKILSPITVTRTRINHQKNAMNRKESLNQIYNQVHNKAHKKKEHAAVTVAHKIKNLHAIEV